jgi:hypothetical protein
MCDLLSLFLSFYLIFFPILPFVLCPNCTIALCKVYSYIFLSSVFSSSFVFFQLSIYIRHWLLQLSRLKPIIQFASLCTWKYQPFPLRSIMHQFVYTSDFIILSCMSTAHVFFLPLFLFILFHFVSLLLSNCPCRYFLFPFIWLIRLVQFSVVLYQCVRRLVPLFCLC